MSFKSIARLDMSSSSDTGDGNEEKQRTSPRLAHCLRAACTEFLPEFVLQGQTYGLWSVYDAAAMTTAMFVSESAGASVLEMAQMVALKPEAYEPAVTAALPGEVVQQSMLASKKHKSKEFELGCNVGESSSKSEARVKHDAVVDDLLVLMDDTQRSSLYEGFSTIPAQFQRELARRTVSNAGGTDSLRGARDALRRLREWYITKFGEVEKLIS